MKLVINKIKALAQESGKLKAVFSNLGFLSFAGMKKRILSVDFSQPFVTIAYIETKGGAFTLLSYDFKKVSSSTADLAELKNFISGFLKKKAILERNAVLTIADRDSCVIRLLTLPALPKDEIPQAAKWQLKDEAPFDLEKAAMDFQVVNEHSDADGVKKNDIICVLAKQELVDSCLSVVTACGLSPIIISNPFINYAYILSNISDNPHICAVLDITCDDSTFCIYRGNKPYFIRNLSFSSDGITQALTDVLVSDKGKIELSLERAEEIKKEFGIPLDAAGTLKDNLQPIHVISLMRPLLEGLVKELKLSFNYFASNFKENLPSVLYITGTGASLKNLDAYLNKELNCKVIKLPLPSFNLQSVDKEKLSLEQDQITSCAAATLAPAAAIDLLPREIKNKKIELIQRTSLRLLAIVLGSILLLSLFMSRLEIRDYQKRREAAQVHLQTIEKLRTLRQKSEVLDNFINQLQNGKVPPYGLLKQVSAHLPNVIALSELVLDQQKHIVVFKGEVSVAGHSAEEVLTGFMELIEKSPLISEASLVFSRDTGQTHTFEMQCDLVK
jgi:type IV pilus assembly protein PilM